MDDVRHSDPPYKPGLTLDELAPKGLRLDSSRIAYFLLFQRLCIDCNLQAQELLKGRREQIIGHNLLDFSPTYQADGSLSADRVLRVSREVIGGENPMFEWQYRTFDGGVVDVEVIIDPILRSEGTYFIATVRDVGDRKRVQAELATSNERLRWLIQVSTRLHGKRSINDVAWESVSILVNHISAPRVSFFLYHKETDEFEVMASMDAQQRVYAVVGTRHPHMRHPSFQSALSDIHVIQDFANAPILPELKALVLERGIQSTVTIWLRRDGEDLGMIAMEYSNPDSLKSTELDDLQAFGKTVSMALANARHLADIEFQASHDILTGLPNRTTLHAKLSTLIEAAASDSKTFGLLLIDLDRFKDVNDTLGHHFGDILLQEVGPRIALVLGQLQHFFCRLGGDEFAIGLIDEDRKSIESCAKQIVSALKRPFVLAGKNAEIGASIGIAFSEDGTDSRKLLRRADLAMYNAKRARTGVCVYDPELDERSPDRLTLMNELHTAISAHQLELYYQPKIEIKSGGILGFEALVRWNHPSRGLMMPDTFIPLAEMGEIIQPLTLEIIRLALSQQQKWRREGRPYHMAVNLSARNLADTHCIEQIRRLIEHFEVEPGTLEFEITETALLTDPRAAATTLRGLALLGIRFAIDDFGTGYSSLSHLHSLQIHSLKIDRSFTREMLSNKQAAAIVKSTISLAHNLELQAIAEGVEDEQTLALLESNGCDLAQGYFISRPLSAAAIEKFLMNTEKLHKYVRPKIQ